MIESIAPIDRVDPDDLRDVWTILPPQERVEAFQKLSRHDAEHFFLELGSPDQADVLRGLPQAQRRLWLRLLPLDDLADVLQHVSSEARPDLLALLDEATRKDVSALLAYAEDDAGGLMNPRFARVRPDMTVDEALRYVRKQAQERRGQIYYVYVIDPQHRLVGVTSFQELFAAPGDRRIHDMMVGEVVSVPETLDQEHIAALLTQYGLVAVPVVDAEGVMRGIVSADDVVDVVQEEATEDIQKLGGMEALEDSYLRTPFGELLRKRAGWLALLFLGEMLTASAMAHFEDEIARAVILAVFIPLIISSGGNSGSQATTLVIRALALDEIKLRDWVRVARRELTMGLSLGAILAVIGLLRVLVWQAIFHDFGDHALRIGLAVSASLVGVVTFGTLAGSMLPFVLRRLGLDPASASAPLVATLVDVTGLVIYFSVAAMLLRGAVL